jgi:hypothetical protein
MAATLVAIPNLSICSRDKFNLLLLSAAVDAAVAFAIDRARLIASDISAHEIRIQFARPKGHHSSILMSTHFGPPHTELRTIQA